MTLRQALGAETGIAWSQNEPANEPVINGKRRKDVKSSLILDIKGLD